MRPSIRHTLNSFFDISRHVTSMVLPRMSVSIGGLRLPKQSTMATCKFDCRGHAGKPHHQT